MKINRLAVQANPGGALHQKLAALANRAMRSASALANCIHKRIGCLAVAIAIIGVPATELHAATVDLAWDANPENNIIGYRVSFGTAPGAYPNAINVGATPSASVTGLSEGTTYYFVVAAVNQANQQGEASSEVSHRIPFSTLIPSTGWILKYADSEESADFQAANVFDGDPATIWHTSWTNPAASQPHEIQINLGSSQSLIGFRYLPRMGSFLVGNVGQYEFYVSADGVNWGNPVAAGTFANTGDLKEVRFSETTGRFVKFRGLTDASGGTYMSVAELYLLQGSSTPAANQAPVASAKSVTTSEDVAVAITLSGTDADGNTLTYSATNPSKGTLSGTAPDLTYTPNADSNGSDSFTYRVNDGIVSSAYATVSITVSAVNDPPVAVSKSVSTAEDTALPITVSASDKESSSLTYSLVNGPSNGSLAGTLPNVTFSPAANYSGSDQFTFRANDGAANSNTATISITVTGVNDAPVAISKSVATVKNTALSIPLTGSDPEGTPLFFSVLSGPSNGTLSGTAPNLTYQPAAGYTGNDQFTFKTNDGSLNSPAATVSITVSAPPTIDGFTVLPRTGWSLKYVDSEETFDSPGNFAFDGNISTFWHTKWRTSSLPALPHEIQINLGSNPSICGFQYLPRQDGFSVGNIGKYEFYVSLDGTNWGSPVATGTFANNLLSKQITFTSKSGQFVRLIALSEASGSTETAVAELNILKGIYTNQSPTALPQSITTESDTPVALTLSGSDPNGDALAFSIVSSPAHGTLSGTAPHFTYLPDPDFVGDDQFTFQSSDGAVYSAASTVSITITPVSAVPGNFAPVFSGPVIADSAQEEKFYQGQLIAYDANPGDVLTFRKLSGPTWLTVTATGTLVGTPLNSHVGTNTFTVKVSDQHAASGTATVIITVVNVNDPPIFKVSPIIYPAGTEKVAYRDQTLAPVAYDPDPADTFSYSKISGPSWLTIAPDGTLKGTPPSDSAGSNQFTIRATDSAGASAEEILEIKINSNTLPLPWKLELVGRGNLAGSANYAAGVFTVAGSGALDEKSDASNFGWQTLSGNGQISARIAKLDDTGNDTRVGLMIRDSLAPDARQAFIGVNGNGDLRWIKRSKTGEKAIETARKLPESNDTWLRLVRNGNAITAFRSTNGTKWTESGSLELKLPSNCYIGLSVSSGDKDLLNTSKFSNVRVTP